jgi:hypothetical protein
MISARRVSQSIRSWSYLGAMPIVAALAVAACGGKVVVDGNGGGNGGAGGTTESSAAVNPSSSSSGLNTCDAAAAHLKECEPSIGDIPPIAVCDGMILCQFTCILNASCPALLGTDPIGVQVAQACVSACL